MDFTRKVTLPGAVTYKDEDFSKEITLKNMVTTDEKCFLTMEVNEAIDKVLKNCIVEPKGLKVEDLLIGDKLFLLMELRILTYGEEMASQFSHECGYSGPVLFLVDSMGLHTIKSLDEFNKQRTFTLPVSGDEIVLMHLTGSRLDALEKRVESLRKNAGVTDIEGLRFILNKASIIESVKGKFMTLGESQKYVETLHGKDSAYLDHRSSKLALGYDLVAEVICPACGKKSYVPVRVNREFFSTTF